MSADNFMYIRKVGGWYIVTMESASNEDGPADEMFCYKCGQEIRPDLYGLWVNGTDEAICPKVEDTRQGAKHFPGGYTRIFQSLGEAWQYAEDEASGKYDAFGMGTEYGTSYSEVVAKEMAERLR